jgi:GntR family transcriptional repressor for pyruvate dehydrogenase complex
MSPKAKAPVANADTARERVGLRETVRMHERLAVGLASQIVAGALAEGAVFPGADDLVREYGVSRTVARETMQALSAAGLITIQHGKRTIVNPIVEWHLLDDLIRMALAEVRVPRKLFEDLFEARLHIEMTIARLAAERIGADDATRLLELPTLTQTENLGMTMATDREFHSAIAEAAGNAVLAQMARDIHRSLRATWDPALSKRLANEVRVQHQAIATAIASHEPDKAVAAVKRHIEWTRAKLAPTTLSPS